MERKRVVIDTNIILVSISKKSPHNWIFQKLINGEFEICVTTEILLEYAEIIERHMGKQSGKDLMGIFDNLENIVYINTYYGFRLLADPDDNKFIDCAIAAGADFIVSHDKDFKKLNVVPFPEMEVIDINEFKHRVD